MERDLPGPKSPWVEKETPNFPMRFGSFSRNSLTFPAALK
jgi:hypothetical protein